MQWVKGVKVRGKLSIGDCGKVKRWTGFKKVTEGCSIGGKCKKRNFRIRSNITITTFHRHNKKIDPMVIENSILKNLHFRRNLFSKFDAKCLDYCEPYKNKFNLIFLFFFPFENIPGRSHITRSPEAYKIIIWQMLHVLCTFPHGPQIFSENQ